MRRNQQHPSYLISFVVGVCAIIGAVSAWTPASTATTTRSLIASRKSSTTTLQEAAITLDGKEIRGPITALGNNILCRVKDTLTATSGGILLPDQAKERPTEGLVLESGPGKIHPYTAVRISNPIKVGMSVLYGKYDGRQVEYKGEECQVVRDDDILLYYTGVSMKLDTVIPCRDYVLVKLDEKLSEESMQTKSGVVIAAQVMKDNLPCEGIVAKVGEGRMASLGNLTKSPVQPGEKVKWKDYAGNEVMIEGKPYSVVKMVNILCTLKE
jgi:chaperonin GroES